MKNLLVVLMSTISFLVMMFSCGPSKQEIRMNEQREQIMNELPNAIHVAVCEQVLENKLEDFNNEAAEYVENQIENATKSFNKKRYDIWTMDLYDSMDELNVAFGGKSSLEKFNDKVDEYMDFASSRLDDFNNITVSIFDSLLYKVGSAALLPDEYRVYVCAENVVGAFDNEYDFAYNDVAMELAKSVIMETSMPVISALDYNKDTDIWTVCFENFKTLHVKLYDKINGGYEMELLD